MIQRFRVRVPGGAQRKAGRRLPEWHPGHIVVTTPIRIASGGPWVAMSSAATIFTGVGFALQLFADRAGADDPSAAWMRHLAVPLAYLERTAGATAHEFRASITGINFWLEHIDQSFRSNLDGACRQAATRRRRDDRQGPSRPQRIDRLPTPTSINGLCRKAATRSWRVEPTSKTCSVRR